MRDDFAVFILTHGRAKQQKTVKTLKRCGYTGRLYLIVDDEDKELDEYIRLYGSDVITFSKREIEPCFDTMTNKKEYGSAVYARNASYDIAHSLGIRWIFMCDDDISNLQYRVLKNKELKSVNIYNIDKLFERMCDIANAGKVCIFGFSQAGAFIGGANKTYLSGHQRKVSQAVLYDANNPITFRGVFYEDIIVALDAGTAGRVAMSTMLVSIQSPAMASNGGGMQDLYQESGTYVRCFYSVMAYPGVASIEAKDGEFKLRLRHSAFAPMIINERWRK